MIVQGIISKRIQSRPFQQIIKDWFRTENSN